MSNNQSTEREAVFVGVALLIGAIIITVVAVTNVATRQNARPAVERAAAAVTWAQLEPGFRAELEHDNCQQLSHEWVLLTPGGFDDQLTQTTLGHDASALRAYVLALLNEKGCSIA